MELKSNLLEIKEIKKKATVHGLKDLNVGDRIYLTTTMQYTTGCRGCYASTFKVHKEDGAVIYKQTQSIMTNVLERAFVLAEVK